MTYNNTLNPPSPLERVPPHDLIAQPFHCKRCGSLPRGKRYNMADYLVAVGVMAGRDSHSSTSQLNLSRS